MLIRVIELVRGRGVSVIHSHGKRAGVHGRLAARLTGIPAVHTFHGIHFERYAPPARAASSWSAPIVNVSREQEREGLALRLFAAGRSRMIRNGVDVARLAAALARGDAPTALKLPMDAMVVGAVARFDEVKRLDVLIDAVAQLPGVTLALIGHGAESARLRALAARHALGPRVRFVDEVDNAAGRPLAFDVYAGPSRTEGLPMAVLEAIALGLPVVASDIPAHRELREFDAREMRSTARCCDCRSIDTMRVLITGITAFVRSHLAEWAPRAGRRRRRLGAVAQQDGAHRAPARPHHARELRPSRPLVGADPAGARRLHRPPRRPELRRCVVGDADRDTAHQRGESDELVRGDSPARRVRTVPRDRLQRRVRAGVPRRAAALLHKRRLPGQGR